jgi:hypothetical protein
MTIQVTYRRGSYGRDRDGRKKDERKTAKKGFRKIAFHSLLRPGLASGDSTRGIRSRGCGKSLLVRDQGAQLPSAPRIPFTALVHIPISILLVSLDFIVAEVVEKRCERGDWIHWPSTDGGRGRKAMWRSSSWRMDPSEVMVCPKRKRDFWYVWTCSRMQYAMAVLDQTAVMKSSVREYWSGTYLAANHPSESPSLSTSHLASSRPQ